MKLKIAIIEDEPNNLALLKSLITSNLPGDEIVGEAGGVESAIELLQSAEVHVVLLDIEIKNGNGFDVLQRLGKYNFEVIFTTAFAEYALDAIKRRAFDYLLKPIKTSELVETLNECRHRIEEKQKLAQIPAPENDEKYFIYKTTAGTEAFLYDDILYLMANGAYTQLILKKTTRIISKNIGEIEELLPTTIFFRTHHSFIVNRHYILRAELKRSGSIELADGVVIPVSQRKKKDFVNFLNNGKA